jgi:hypothetical protein
MEDQATKSIGEEELREKLSFLTKLTTLLEDVKEGNNGSHGEIGVSAKELFESFDEAIATVNSLPGIDSSRKRQKLTIDELETDLETKDATIEKYLSKEAKKTAA